ncbi:MAG: FG-GAP-like repeat-containing protein [Cyanobacteria bacterium J06581_3]
MATQAATQPTTEQLTNEEKFEQRLIARQLEESGAADAMRAYGDALGKMSVLMAEQARLDLDNTPPEKLELLKSKTISQLKEMDKHARTVAKVQRMATLEKKISILNSQASPLKQSIGDYTKQLSALDVEIDSLQNSLNNTALTQAQTAGINKQLASLQSTVGGLQASKANDVKQLKFIETDIARNDASVKYAKSFEGLQKKMEVGMGLMKMAMNVLDPDFSEATALEQSKEVLSGVGSLMEVGFDMNVDKLDAKFKLAEKKGIPTTKLQQAAHKLKGKSNIAGAAKAGIAKSASIAADVLDLTTTAMEEAEDGVDAAGGLKIAAKSVAVVTDIIGLIPHTVAQGISYAGLALEQGLLMGSAIASAVDEGGSDEAIGAAAVRGLSPLLIPYFGTNSYSSVGNAIANSIEGKPVDYDQLGLDIAKGGTVPYFGHIPHLAIAGQIAESAINIRDGKTEAEKALAGTKIAITVLVSSGVGAGAAAILNTLVDAFDADLFDGETQAQRDAGGRNTLSSIPLIGQIADMDYTHSFEKAKTNAQSQMEQAFLETARQEGIGDWDIIFPHRWYEITGLAWEDGWRDDTGRVQYRPEGTQSTGRKLVAASDIDSNLSHLKVEIGEARTMYGGDQDDLFYSHNNSDAFMSGLGGDDLFYVGTTASTDSALDWLPTFDGGSGTDTFNFAGMDMNTASGAELDLNEGVYAINRTSGGYADGEVRNMEVVVGSDGDDMIYGDAADNKFYGGKGDDELVGGEGNDQLIGNEGSDTLQGDEGNDVLIGGEGSDIMQGGAGDDAIVLDAGEHDVIDGGDGWDTLLVKDFGQQEAKIAVGETNRTGFRTVSGIEEITSSEAGESVSILSADGADIIVNLRGGDDSLDFQNMAGTGDALIFAGEGNDTINNLDSTGSDHVTIYGEAGDDKIQGGHGKQTLYGGQGDDELIGDGGDDILYGNDGADTLVGGSGDDILIGGAGDDVLMGFSGADTFLFSRGDGKDLVVSDGADKVVFEEGITPEDLHFDNEGNDVVIWIKGTNDRLRIAKWFSEPHNRPEILTQEGLRVSSELENLEDQVALMDNSPKPTNIVEAGDFDGDGTQEALWQDAETGQVYASPFDAKGATTGARAVGDPVASNERLIGAADFTGDGIDDILWLTDNGRSGQVHAWEMNENGFVRDYNIHYGTLIENSDLLGAGDFDGDGQQNILWKSSNGILHTWAVKPDGKREGNYTPIENLSPEAIADWSLEGIADFDGDGTDDLLWRTDTGSVKMFEMKDGAVKAIHDVSLADAPAGTNITGGDFNADGKADFLVENPVGEVQLIDGNTTTEKLFMEPNWEVVGTGNYDGEGGREVLVRNLETGQVQARQADGSSYDIGSLVTGNWSVAASGDINADGSDDILLHNSNSGEVKVWAMDWGEVAAEYSIGSAGADWMLAGAGDTNADGTDDLLFYNQQTGAVQVWEMAEGWDAYRENVGSNDLALVGSGDFDNNGTDDLLFANPGTSQVQVWAMQEHQRIATYNLDSSIAGEGSILLGTSDVNSKKAGDLLWQDGGRVFTQSLTVGEQGIAAGNTVNQDVNLF